DNISSIFQASQTVLDILNELPVEKEGKVQDSSDLLDFSDVTVDDEGNAVVDHEIVVNQQMRLFGEKVYALGESVTEVMAQNEEKSHRKLASELSQTVSPVIVEDLKAEYNLKTREADHIKKQITAIFENEIRKNDIERKISEAHIKQELQQQIKEAVDKEQKDKIQEDFDKRLEENNL
ncbi:restriction endonuclease, partial [Streptococcus pseudopneumoniae]